VEIELCVLLSFLSPPTTTGYQVMSAMYLSQRRHRIIIMVPTATFGF